MIEAKVTPAILALAPTVDVLGSYFPAWMLCFVIGLALTVVVHAILIGFRIAQYIRLKPVTYTSMSLLFTLMTWLMFFRN